ncbi:LLM class flavin-dependent oxidoreductase [Aromatoleum toluclasticum]|uniref:LLM class flavin-dependent oxidoreductase n=1 Tax=Aromatoleum toluclasticum TaxID=92003 RepID=UPI000379FE5D|nr:LLM class flavin-dependent oxidoreductase [Aromatoleum toluclasticum]
MKVGLSWDLGGDEPAATQWHRVIGEIERGDALGFDSAWVAEGKTGQAGCAQPAVFMTFAARRTKSIHCRALARSVAGEFPVRLAEEITLLDQFSHGRGGVAYAPASRQKVDPLMVHETIEFIRGAWATNEVRYRGKYVRFPTHTPDDAPAGLSYPAWTGEYLPQWEWGATRTTADFLALTPKPVSTHLPVYVAIDDDETLEWAARNGVSPYAGVNLTTAEAIERLARYRAIADGCGRHSYEVEAVLERNVAIDGASDAHTFGGSAHDITCAIRAAAAATRIGHFVWRYRDAAPNDLERFANEVQTRLQA